MNFSPFQLRAISALRCVRCHNPMRPEKEALRCFNCGNSYQILPGNIIDITGRPAAELTLAQRAGQWRMVAWLYDRIWRTRALSVLTGRRFSSRTEIRKILDSVDVARAEVILDNACANAYYGRAAARSMKRLRSRGGVIANDISLPMLRTALSLARKERLDDRILFIRSDSQEMPFASGSLDGALCGGSLNEFRHPQRVLAELHRVLKRKAHAGLMMQVASSDRLGYVQRLLGGVSGLAFPTAQEALGWMRRHFVATVTHEEGAVLMVKLAVPSTH